jgi:RNA polymerase sigma-70 factor (ECF subfamily)
MAKASTSIGTPPHALVSQRQSTERKARTSRFEQTIMPHLDAAYNLARWLTRNDSDAQDVVQDAYLRAFKYFDSFQGENPSAWLLAIVRNACFTWMRRNRPREEVAGSDALDADIAGNAEPLFGGGGSRELATDPETLLIEARDRTQVNELVAKLPAEFREVIVLREMEDLSYREIADIVGIPIGTVMSRLSRARKLLRDSWSPTGEAELNPDATERHRRASGISRPHSLSLHAANPGTL